MIQIQQVKLPVNAKEEALIAACAKELGCRPQDILHMEIRKKSIDARKKPALYSVYTVWADCGDREEKILNRRKNRPNISRANAVTYAFSPAVFRKGSSRKQVPSPVIVGTGPAGLFCGYLLALWGLCPILLERGRPAQQRLRDVTAFWETGMLDPASNVQFGEGGAGTFSDGKLNTLVKDKDGRNRFVLETFVRFGAPEHILWDQKPHIGTDLLIGIVSGIREEICRLGGQVRFETCVDTLLIENGSLAGFGAGEERFFCRDGVLAIGHSARDTFQMLQRAGVHMEAKDFAVGFRIEHPQKMIDESQYGLRPGDIHLPPAPYKLATKLQNGRGVYSFCMCPGGYVVNASSEAGRLVVNGMSYSGRNSANANSAIVVSVGEREFDKRDPLSGVRYQRGLEERAFALCGGKIPQQLFGDFRRGRVSTGYGAFASMAKGAADFAPLQELLSAECNEAFLAGMELFGKKIRGFDRDDAILSGIESRTSSPVRICRDERFYSNVEGLYPCGEGAGYAGGITSAAMDGLKTAEKILQKYEITED